MLTITPALWGCGGHAVVDGLDILKRWWMGRVGLVHALCPTFSQIITLLIDDVNVIT
jgi:hypothetical protein